MKHTHTHTHIHTVKREREREREREKVLHHTVDINAQTHDLFMS